MALDGTAEGEKELSLGAAELLAIHRDLVQLRAFDERAVVYQHQGRIGTYAIYFGHEAIQVGTHGALRSDDWIFPTYRESAIGLLRGLPASTILAWWRGHPAGWWNPAEHNLGSICVPIATQVPHAAGLAWGLRLDGGDRCAAVFFGDGATSEGAFHEGINFAAVMEAPLILVCNNNQWAISTPYAKQTRASALVDKAAGYGIPGIRVDGGDVLAVRAAVTQAAKRARAGKGPTLIEAVTYRMAPHGTADDPSVYQDAARVALERQGECLARYEGFLLERGIGDEDLFAAAREEAHAMLKKAMREVEGFADPDPELVFNTTYAEPLPAVVEQRNRQLGQRLK